MARRVLQWLSAMASKTSHPPENLDRAQIWPREAGELLLANLRERYPGYSDAELYCLWQREENDVELDRRAPKFRGRPQEWRAHVHYLEKLAWTEADLEVRSRDIAAAAKAVAGQPKRVRQRATDPAARLRATWRRVHRLLQTHPDMTAATLREFVAAEPERAAAFRAAGCRS